MYKNSRSRPKKQTNFRQHRGIKPASLVRRRAKGGGVVEEYVNDILKVIEDDVEKALEAGKDVARTEIQTEFHIPPLTRVNAQRRVYYHLVKELTMSDYTPKIEIIGNKSGAQKVYIHTKWNTHDDDDERDYMDQFLKAHSIITENTEDSCGQTGRRRRRPRKK